MTDGFEAIYRAQHAAVYRHCLRLLGNPEDAAEATQEVFSKLLHHMVELDNPGAWLHRVAHNHCLNRLRSRGREAGEPHRVGAAADPESQALTRMALSRAFAALTPRERRALTRSVVMDHGVGSVARDLGMTYMAAAQLLSRARRRAAAVAATVVSLAAALAARRAARPPGGARPSWGGQQTMVAVAAALVVGSAASHLGGSPQQRGAVSLPPMAGEPARAAPPPVAATAPPARTAAPSQTLPASSQMAAGAGRAAARGSSTPSPARPTGTPAPVIVGAGTLRCSPDTSAPTLDLGSCRP